MPAFFFFSQYRQTSGGPLVTSEQLSQILRICNPPDLFVVSSAAPVIVVPPLTSTSDSTVCWADPLLLLVAWLGALLSPVAIDGLMIF